MEYDFGTGGYDIEFFLDETELSENDGVVICSNISYNPDDDSERSYLTIYKRATGFEFIVSNGTNDLETFLDVNLDVLGTVRVISHNLYISVYVENRWIHTFSFRYAHHPLTRYVGLKCVDITSVDITNVRVKELADWREAIFIDMETNSMNAISSVILQRPVDIYPTWDGKLSFFYDPDRETVTLVKIGKHRKEIIGDKDACSDGIVYFTDVAVVVDRDYAEEVGFTTRMYRFPDLEQDAVNAAIIQQERARERMRVHKIACRLMPQLELGDIANAAYTKSGTGTVVDDDIIVEEIGYQIGDGDQVMTLSGREDV